MLQKICHMCNHPRRPPVKVHTAFNIFQMISVVMYLFKHVLGNYTQVMILRLNRRLVALSVVEMPARDAWVLQASIKAIIVPSVATDKSILNFIHKG